MQYWKEFSEKYYQIISNELSGLNLTALNSPAEIYTKQVLDSIQAIDQVPTFKNALSQAEIIVDLGTGGGFPLLPVAAIYTNTRCVGIDARNKKLEAVKLIAEKLKLSNIRVLHGTFKEIIFDIPKVVLLVKAVGKTTDIIQELNVKYPTDIFFYKGANFYQLEIEEIEKLKNNEQLVSIQEVIVEGLEKRYIVHCRVDGNVLRGTQKKKHQKIFSEFV